MTAPEAPRSHGNAHGTDTGTGTDDQARRIAALEDTVRSLRSRYSVLLTAVVLVYVLLLLVVILSR